jgi:hypothetical protein
MCSTAECTALHRVDTSTDWAEVGGRSAHSMEVFVQHAMLPSLVAWENFYVIVGSAGGALTGLQFVVMALVAESRRKGSSDTVDAFGTPTIVHFCVVLFVSAVLSSPWASLSWPTIVLGVVGAAGIGYIGVVTRRARRQTEYRPVLEDWIWHNALPFIAYAMLLCGAIALWRYPSEGLFAIAAAAMLLLFIGIHNAWDTVTYVALTHIAQKGANEK